MRIISRLFGKSGAKTPENKHHRSKAGKRGTFDLVANAKTMHQHREQALKQYRENSDILRGYEFCPAPDSCDHCKQVARKKYKLNDTLPPIHEGCTHPKGCRCSIVPILK
jgi:hypothetical protein